MYHISPELSSRWAPVKNPRQAGDRVHSEGAVEIQIEVLRLAGDGDGLCLAQLGRYVGRLPVRIEDAEEPVEVTDNGKIII